MAIWFPPPPPFTGGFQPHSPRQLAPILEDANLPFLRAPTVQTLTAILAWQPPPPDAFMGGRQPLDNRRWRAYPTDNPPRWQFVQQLTAILAWPRDDWPAQRGAAFAKFIRPDFPPLNPRVQNLTAVLAWPPESWGAQRSRLTRWPTDAPPFSQLPIDLASMMAAWPRESWAAQRSPQTLWPPDTPLPRSVAAAMARVLISWPQESWPAQRGATLLPLIPADRPLPLQVSRTLATLFATWPREDWRAQRGAILAPLNFPSTLPPPGIAGRLLTILPSWQPELWPTQRLGRIASLIPQGPVVNNPPLSSRARLLSILWTAWAPPFWSSAYPPFIPHHLVPTPSGAVSPVAFFMVQPHYIDFEHWASTLVVDFPQDFVPTPPQEAHWQDWARDLIASPTFYNQNAPYPDWYANWRDWAVRLYEVMVPSNIGPSP